MESAEATTPDQPGTVETVRMPPKRDTCMLKPLKGRQRTFCSRGKGGCSGKWWDQRHPRLQRLERKSDQPHRQVIFELMADGAWRTLREIAVAVGCTENTAGAKLRDLRKQQFGGFTVEARRKQGYGQEHEYRLVLNAKVEA